MSTNILLLNYKVKLMKTKQLFSLIVLWLLLFWNTESVAEYITNNNFDTDRLIRAVVAALWVIWYIWYFLFFLKSPSRPNAKKDTAVRKWFVAKMGGNKYETIPNWDCVHDILGKMSLRKLYQLRRGYMRLHDHYSDWGEFDSPSVDEMRMERKMEIEKVICLIDKYLPKSKKKDDNEDE